jgi:ubiquinone/menaquinone biosynthesis C-methylase UbiE
MFSNYDTIKNKFFAKLIAEITAGNADSIKLLANSIRILSDSGKYPTIIEDYQTQLISIYNNTAFKLTTRLAVKDFIRE